LGQDSPVTGARLTIVQKNEGGLSVTLSNQRNSALVAWEIGVFRERSDRPVYVTTSDYTRGGNYEPGSGPVRPGESRTVKASAGEGTDICTPAVTFALFADGYYEGRTASVGTFREERRKEAEELRYWLSALSGMPADSDQELRELLRARLSKWAADGQNRASTLGSNLRAAVTDETPRDAGSLTRQVNRLLDEAKSRLAAIESPIASESALRGEVPSIAIRWTLLANTYNYARVENLRDVPLEALKFTKYEGGDRRRSAVLTDLCGYGDGRAGHGPIQPGEIRELRWRDEGGTDQTVKLEFLLFADLKWEGPRSERDDVLKTREGRAADAAYWAEVLTDATLMPAETGVEYLETKKRERAAATALSPHVGFRSEVDETIKRARRAPAEFAATARMFAWRMETYRIQATRHQRRE
jgi:hypothetical protein